MGRLRLRGDRLLRRGHLAPIRLRLPEEGFYIVEGQVTVFADGVEHRLGTGGFAFVPRGTSHGFRLDSGKATLLLLITRGNAGHKSMFREMGEPAAQPELPAPSSAPVDPALMAAIAERHGTIIVGPPPGATS